MSHHIERLTPGFTVQELAAKVRELAEKFPEARYEKARGEAFCSYRDGSAAGQPGCLIGQVLPIGFVEKNYQGGIQSVIEEDHLYDELQAQYDPDNADDLLILRWVGKVQEIQDRGRTWGDAIFLADQQLDVDGESL